jgi:hypothetical protein
MFKKSAKIIAIATLFLLGGAVLFAQEAHAQSVAGAAATFFGLSDIPLSVLTWIAIKITYVIGFVASMMFSLGGFLIDLALELNGRVSQLPMVQTGWTIVLNMTNLAFVLGIIWIAIATIIRMQGYEMKQILWKLIVAAVLVNFSLVIAGFFLDFAGLMTQFFVEKVSPPATASGITSFSSQLAASLQPQNALSIDSGSSFAGAQAEFQKKLGLASNTTEALNDTSAAFNILINLVFGVLFTVIGAITFLGIATMLLVRFLFIAILLILAPIVWLGWVFPVMGKYWSEWWGHFIKWTFFAPISAFFLYLAINAAISVDRFRESFAIDLSGTSGLATAQTALKGVIFNSLENIAQQLIVIGLLIGGLIAAEKSGIAFSGAFKGMAVGVGKWTTDKAKGLGARAATAPLRSQGAKDFLENASKAKWYNPMRYAGMAAARPILSAQTRERAEIDAKIKERDKMPKDLRNLRYAMDFTSSGKMANMMLDARKGDFEGVDMSLARQNGYDKELAGLNPLLEEGANKDGIADAIAEAKKAETDGDKNKKEAALQVVEKRLTEKLSKFKGEDWKKVKLSAMLKGSGTGLDKEELEGFFGRRIAKAFARTASADDASKVMREMSKDERENFISMINKEYDEAELERVNASLLKYLKKGVGQEIFGGGAREEESGGGEKKEEAPKKEGEKK